MAQRVCITKEIKWLTEPTTCSIILIIKELKNTTYSIRINKMKNMAVLKKFFTYIAITVVAGAVFFGITYSAKELLGHGGYGIIAMFAVFTLWFLYSMAKSDVESKEREERYTKERDQQYAKLKSVG